MKTEVLPVLQESIPYLATKDFAAEVEMELSSPTTIITTALRLAQAKITATKAATKAATKPEVSAE